MDTWYDTQVLWGEDSLEAFLDNIKEKVRKLWEQDCQVDAEIKLDYIKNEDTYK